jgi:hypothetical protein
VTVTVNFATEIARVSFPDAVADLIAVVERLQRAGHTVRRRRLAEPDDRGRGDGIQLGVRGDEQPAAAALPAEIKIIIPNGSGLLARGVSRAGRRGRFRLPR